MPLFLLQGRVLFSARKWFPYQDHFLSSGTSYLHGNTFGCYYLANRGPNSGLRRLWKGSAFCKGNGLIWRENGHVFLGSSLVCGCGESLPTWSSGTSLSSGSNLHSQENLTRLNADSAPIPSLWFSHLHSLVLPCLCPPIIKPEFWISLSNLWKRDAVKISMKYPSMFSGNKGPARFCDGTSYPVWCSQPSRLLGALVPAVFSLSWDSQPKSYTAGLFLLGWWAHEGSPRQCLPKGGSRAAWVRVVWDAY